MKKSIQSLFIAASFAAIASANPTVSDILVHQLWPWSQNIKVEYTLTGSGSEEAWNLDVKCYEGNTQIDAAKVNAALCGGEGFHSIVGNGIHTFTLDPSKLLAEGATAISDFTVSVDIAGPGDSLGVRIEYRVFDLETGKVTDLRRRDFIDHPEIYGTVITNYADLHAGFAKPADLPDEDVFIVPGFNTDNVWKTTKLVMKRIPAKKLTQDGTWYMGPVAGDANTMEEGTSDSGTPPRIGESRFPVRLSGDFFIGIFELTQKQYAMLMNGARPSLYTNETYWATRPLENVSWEDFYNNFLPAARTALNKNVAMPSEAQWEFAARAMYDGDGSYFPSGIATDSAGWLAMEGMNGNNTNNSTDRNAPVALGGGHGTVTVGSGLPNPFGLYNLFGNVREFTVDLGNTNLRVYYNDPTEQNPAVDPVCVSASTISGVGAPRVVKGAAYRAKGGQANVLRCATRYAISKSSKYHGDNSARTFGFRLMCPAD